MTNETQNNAISSMLLWSNSFNESRQDFYKASSEDNVELELARLGAAVADAQLAIRFCEEAGFDASAVMGATVDFLKTFGTVEYYNLVKASA